MLNFFAPSHGFASPSAIIRNDDDDDRAFNDRRGTPVNPSAAATTHASNTTVRSISNDELLATTARSNLKQ
jgi:hypothetical protein